MSKNGGVKQIGVGQYVVCFEHLEAIVFEGLSDDGNLEYSIGLQFSPEDVPLFVGLSVVLAAWLSTERPLIAPLKRALRRFVQFQVRALKWEAKRKGNGPHEAGLKVVK